MRTRLFLAILGLCALVAVFVGFTGPPQVAPDKFALLKDVHVIAPAIPAVVIAVSALDALDSATDDRPSTPMIDSYAALDKPIATALREVVAVSAPRVSAPYASVHRLDRYDTDIGARTRLLSMSGTRLLPSWVIRI
jgi:hypothetical protein